MRELADSEKLRGVGRGAAAGALATIPMSLVMLAAQRAGWMGKQPPEKITEAAIDRTADEDVHEPVEDLLSMVNHFAFGAGAGSLFSLVRRRNASQIGQGVLFGAGVWAVSYQGWVPILDIMPPATRDRRGRPVSMLVAHLIFGASLATLLERFDP